jgi:6-phosphofructokinase 1
MLSGNIVIGQSGGPTSVINSTLAGIVEEARGLKNVDKIYGMRFGIEGFLEENLVNLSLTLPGVIEGLRQTPGSALGSSRYKLKNEDLPRVRELLEKYNIRTFFLIGGNDTMDTIHRVEEYCQVNGYPLTGIGAPKTVDNDLHGTDHTPGFPSAARYIALSVQQAGRLAEDMQRVDRFAVFQTIGRDAGWLAGASALARKREGDAPHLIYFPERRLSRERVLSDVKKTIDRLGWCYIVIGEGTLWEDGTPVSASQVRDNFSNIEFGAMGGSSAALSLHQVIHQETGYRGEFQITESLPMCAMDRAGSLDLEEAYTCGTRAVSLAADGVSGVMVAIERESSKPYRVQYTTVPLEEVAIRARPMPDNFINSAGNDITDDFLAYMEPLVDPLPEYSVLTGEK